MNHLLLAAFFSVVIFAAPALADEAASCKATAESIDKQFREAAETEAMGYPDAAKGTRASANSGINSFVHNCLKPRVCDNFWNQVKTTEFARHSADFSAYRNMWQAALDGRYCR